MQYLTLGYGRSIPDEPVVVRDDTNSIWFGNLARHYIIVGSDHPGVYLVFLHFHKSDRWTESTMATDAVVSTPCHRYLCTLPGIRDCCSCEMRFCGEHSNLVRYADGSALHRTPTVDIHVVHLII